MTPWLLITGGEAARSPSSRSRVSWCFLPAYDNICFTSFGPADWHRHQSAARADGFLLLCHFQEKWSRSAFRKDSRLSLHRRLESRRCCSSSFRLTRFRERKQIDWFFSLHAGMMQMKNQNCRWIRLRMNTSVDSPHSQFCTVLTFHTQDLIDNFPYFFLIIIGSQTTDATSHILLASFDQVEQAVEIKACASVWSTVIPSPLIPLLLFRQTEANLSDAVVHPVVLNDNQRHTVRPSAFKSNK